MIILFLLVYQNIEKIENQNNPRIKITQIDK